MNSIFLHIKYAAVKMEQGPRLGTNEEVGLLCSNSRWNFLTSQVLHVLKLGAGLDPLVWREDSRTRSLFSGLHTNSRTSVRGNCCILLAGGDCIFAWHLLPLSHPTWFAHRALFSYSGSDYVSKFLIDSHQR